MVRRATFAIAKVGHGQIGKKVLAISCQIGKMIGMSNSADLLTEYLDDAGETLSSLAARIGRSPSTLTRALRGERDASLKLARDVERGTNGRVSASDFIALCLRAQNDTPTTPEAA